MPHYIGRYINMDRSVERRVALEERFAALGCADRYRRFTGVDGRDLDSSRVSISPGEYGCFMSHYECIKESMGEDAHLHIVEDDVVFGPRTIPILDQTIEDGLRLGEMMFTDVFVPADLASMIQLMNFYRLSGVLEDSRGSSAAQPKFVNFIDLKNLSFAGSSSYVLRKSGRGRMLELMEAELLSGPTDPIDIFFNRIVHEGHFTATCTLPFLSSVDVEAIVSTTIDGRSQHDRSALAFYMLRNYFFVDKDKSALARLAIEMNEGIDDLDYMNTILDAFRFIFSEKFIPF